MASASPLLWSRLPAQISTQILSGSSSSTVRLLKSFLFLGPIALGGAYHTGGAPLISLNASGGLHDKYVYRVE